MCKEATKDRHFSSDPIDEAVNMFIAGISVSHDFLFLVA